MQKSDIGDFCPNPCWTVFSYENYFKRNYVNSHHWHHSGDHPNALINGVDGVSSNPGIQPYPLIILKLKFSVKLISRFIKKNLREIDFTLN